MCRISARLIVGFVAVLLTSLVSQQVWAEYQFGKIALTGEIAPGSGGSGADVPFAEFDEFVLNDVGEVAFIAETSANTDGNISGIFKNSSGGMNSVVFDGEIAAGSGGSGADMPFIGFEDLLFNDAGEVAFRGGTEFNSDGYFIGLFSNVGGLTQAIAFQGDIALGSGGSGADVPFATFRDAVLNDAGEVVFRGHTTTNADGHFAGIYSTVGGVLGPVAIPGQIAPGSGGSGSDVPFAHDLFIRPDLNDSGEIAFRSPTATNSDGDRNGIFSTSGGSLHAVVFSGQLAPGSGGSGSDVEFEIFTSAFSHKIALNAAGEVAFHASTTENVDFDSDGFFSTVGGSLHAVAFTGQIAPGSGGSGTDVEFDLDNPQYDAVVLNDMGDMAFHARTDTNVDGGNNGIFSTSGGSLQTVAFEQQIAPGSGGSGADVPFLSLGIPVQDAEGNVAFWAETVANVDGGDRGIFRSNNGVLEAIVFEGDELEVSPGVFRTIDELSFLRSEHSNDLGQIAFEATFTDGSVGLFVATPVPEPSTGLLVLAGIVGSCGLARLRPRHLGAEF